VAYDNMLCLTAITLCNTAWQLGYIVNQNMFNMFFNNDPEEQSTDNNAMTVTQKAAAATAGTSTLGITYAATASAAISQEVTCNKTIVGEPNCHHAADGGNVIQPPPGSTQHCSCATHSQRSNPNAADRWVSTGTWWETGQYLWW
jgi:hypothetical protein